LSGYYENADRSNLAVLPGKQQMTPERWRNIKDVVGAVLVLRAHHTTDVFTAITAALYVDHLAERISPPLGRKLATYLASPQE